MENEMIKQEEKAILKQTKKKKYIGCRNPDCDYRTCKKEGPHICPKCGWIADVNFT